MFPYFVPFSLFVIIIIIILIVIIFTAIGLYPNGNGARGITLYWPEGKALYDAIDYILPVLFSTISDSSKNVHNDGVFFTTILCKFWGKLFTTLFTFSVISELYELHCDLRHKQKLHLFERKTGKYNWILALTFVTTLLRGSKKIWR